MDRGAAWYEARTKCIGCLHDRVCEHWLDCAIAPAMPPSFCPNAEFFRQCLKSSALTRRAA
jgi:hypothetical protein